MITKLAYIWRTLLLHGGGREGTGTRRLWQKLFMYKNALCILTIFSIFMLITMANWTCCYLPDGVLPTLEFYTHLGYRRKGEDSWKLYHKGHENRSLDCKFFQSTVGKFIGKSVFQTSDRIKKLQ